jgi:hypothetical protein
MQIESNYACAIILIDWNRVLETGVPSPDPDLEQKKEKQ